MARSDGRKLRSRKAGEPIVVSTSASHATPGNQPASPPRTRHWAPSDTSVKPCSRRMRSLAVSSGNSSAGPAAAARSSIVWLGLTGTSSAAKRDVNLDATGCSCGPGNNGKTGSNCHWPRPTTAGEARKSTCPGSDSPEAGSPAAAIRKAVATARGALENERMAGLEANCGDAPARRRSGRRGHPNAGWLDIEGRTGRRKPHQLRVYRAISGRDHAVRKSRTLAASGQAGGLPG